MSFLVQLLTSIFIAGQASLSDGITSHIERCELNSTSLVDIHTCLKAEYKLKVIEGDYVSASQLLKTLSTKVQSYGSKDSKEYSEQLIVLGRKMELVQYQEGLESPLKLYRHDDGDYFSVRIGEDRWVIDTGATFGAIDSNSTSCTASGPDESMIIAAHGTVERSAYCIYSLSGFGQMPLNVTSGDNILGLLYLIPHREIFFASPDQDTVYSSVPFDYSGQYLTIKGEIKIGSKSLDNSVMCLDSGAKESIIAKSIYKNISAEYSNIEVDILNYSSPFGERRILVKKIPSAHILAGSKEANFSSIPVSTSSDISLDCDIVLGMDFLKDVVSLNFSTKTLRIK